MNDPQTWTTVWELTVGAGGGMGGGGQRGENWDNCNRIARKGGDFFAPNKMGHTTKEGLSTQVKNADSSPRDKTPCHWC